MSVKARARRSDPETSHQAAASVTDIRGSQKAVLRVLGKRPTAGYTDEELISVYREIDSLPWQSESGIRSRRAELVALGLAEDSGERRPMMETGRMARVWRIAR